jgi:hypothetical protein
VLQLQGAQQGQAVDAGRLALKTPAPACPPPSQEADARVPSWAGPNYKFN